MSEADLLEALRAKWVGRSVTVDARRPELSRFAGRSGRVTAINLNGQALVEFAAPDLGWYDIAPEYLKAIESEPTAAED